MKILILKVTILPIITNLGPNDSKQVNRLSRRNIHATKSMHKINLKQKNKYLN